MIHPILASTLLACLGATTLPATLPAAGRAPTDALALYAAGRGSAIDGRPYEAVDFLQQAAAADPQSADVQVALGEAYRQTRDPRADAAYARAAELDPARADVQLALAAISDRSGDAAGAISHLRLARQTAGYEADEGLAAEVDFLLAELLRKAGDGGAALESYQSAERRLRASSMAVHARPLGALLARQPGRLYGPIAELQQTRGDPEAALATARKWAEADPASDDAQSRVVDLLLSLNHPAEAVRSAAEGVARDGASAESLKRLRDVCRRAGGRDRAIDALIELRADRPADRPLLLALASEYRVANRPDEGIALLSATAIKDRGDAAILRALMLAQAAAGRPGDAAAAWAEAVATDPARLDPLMPLLVALMGPASDVRLTVGAIDAAQVPDAAKPALLFAAFTVADREGRHLTADQRLDAAVAAGPLFARAYTAKLQRLFLLDADGSKVQSLIANARRRDSNLATELEALILLHDDQPADAAAALGKIAAGSAGPRVSLEQAAALQKAGDSAGLVRVLWRVVTKYPEQGAAWSALVVHHFKASEFDRSSAALRQWLAADQMSLDGRLTRAALAGRAGESAAAEAILLKLLDEEPADLGVLGAARQYYLDAGRAEDWVKVLGGRLDRDPGQLGLVRAAAEALAARGDPAAATSRINAARAVRPTADRLYDLSGCADAAGLEQLSRDLLHQALEIDPGHALSANNLAYRLAEDGPAGSDLEEAGRLAEIAVAAEPDNSAALDTLGWVRYKRGDAAGAVKALERAVAANAPVGRIDPTVRDHLGDALWRLGKRDTAVKRWCEAAAALEESAGPLGLAESVQSKLAAAAAGETPVVAGGAYNGVKSKD